MLKDIHLETSRLIKKWSEDNYSILYEEAECGWMDGGCLLFANVFKKAIEEVCGDTNVALVSVGREFRYGDHVAIECVKTNGIQFYIDADGIQSAEQINRKMIENEFLPCSVIRGYAYSNKGEIRNFEETELPMILEKRLRESELPAMLLKLLK